MSSGSGYEPFNTDAVPGKINYLIGQVSQLVKVLTVYCEVYAVHCQPNPHSNAETYISTSDWNELFGLGSILVEVDGRDTIEGRTIIDFLADLRELEKVLNPK